MATTSKALFLFLCLALNATTLHGREMRHGPFAGDFSMQFGREDFDVDYEDGDDNSSIENGFLTVTLLEALTSQLQGGIKLGYVGADQEQRVASAGINLKGYTLGVLLRGHLPVLTESLNLEYGLEYGFNDMDGSTEDKNAELEWHALTGKLGLGVNLNLLRLHGGALYTQIDGKERVSGDSVEDATNDFSESNSEGVYFGIGYQLDDSGFIGLDLESGSVNRLIFNFQRSF